MRKTDRVTHADLRNVEVMPKAEGFVMMPLTEGHIVVHTLRCHLKNPFGGTVEAMYPVSRAFVENALIREAEARSLGATRHAMSFCGYCTIRDAAGSRHVYPVDAATA